MNTPKRQGSVLERKDIRAFSKKWEPVFGKCDKNKELRHKLSDSIESHSALIEKYTVIFSKSEKITVYYLFVIVRLFLHINVQGFQCRAHYTT